MANSSEAYWEIDQAIRKVLTDAEFRSRVELVLSRIGGHYSNAGGTKTLIAFSNRPLKSLSLLGRQTIFVESDQHRLQQFWTCAQSWSERFLRRRREFNLPQFRSFFSVLVLAILVVAVLDDLRYAEIVLLWTNDLQFPKKLTQDDIAKIALTRMLLVDSGAVFDPLPWKPETYESICNNTVSNVSPQSYFEEAENAATEFNARMRKHFSNVHLGIG